MHSVIVDLVISPEEYLKLYQGLAEDVFTRSRDGRSVRFPASILRPFVTASGISGSFKIVFDDGNRFHHIEKIP